MVLHHRGDGRVHEENLREGFEFRRECAYPRAAIENPWPPPDHPATHKETPRR